LLYSKKMGRVDKRGDTGSRERERERERDGVKSK